MPNQIQFSPFLNPVGAPTYQQAGSGLLKKINKFAKKTGIISKGLNIAGDLTGMKSLKQASKVAKVVGYGMPTTKTKKRSTKAKK